MTGVGFFNSLKIKLAEVGSGFLPNAIAQDIVNTANINIAEKKIQEYQLTNKITREVQPLISTSAVLTPINATIDLSATSVVVPQYYQLINLYITSPFMGSTFSAYAKERQSLQWQNTLTEGTAMYPKYKMSAGILTIEPANAISCIVTYFTTPIPIDITDNSTQIAYNPKLLQLLLYECMTQAGVDTRDLTTIQLGQTQEQSNR